MGIVTAVVQQQAARMENTRCAWYPALVQEVTVAIADKQWNDEKALRMEVRKQIRAKQKALVGSLRKHAYRLANGDVAMTGDLSQEAWVRALEDGRDKPGLCRTTRGHMRTHLKQNISPVTVPVDELRRAARAALPGKDIDMTKERDISCSATVLQADDAFAVRETFSRLDEDDQAVLTVAVIDGQGVSGVSSELKVTLCRAKAMVDKAMLALRTEWEND